MKLTYTTADGRLKVELEEDSQVDLWRSLAKFQEVFEDTASGNTTDGKGGKTTVTSNDFRYRVRTATGLNEKGKQEEYEYFEKIVVSGPLAGYKKMYGVHNDKTGGLFPKKAPDKDVIYGYNGWHKYNGPKKEYNQSSQASSNSVPTNDATQVPDDTIPF